MKIDENYTVTAGSDQWTLRYEEKNNVRQDDGSIKEVTSSDQWYFSRLEQALKKYLDRSMHFNIDVSTAYGEIKNSMKLIDGFCEGIKRRDYT